MLSKEELAVAHAKSIANIFRNRMYGGELFTCDESGTCDFERLISKAVLEAGADELADLYIESVEEPHQFMNRYFGAGVL